MIKIILIFSMSISMLIAADRPKIALVLSGGAARGAAHVGVLKVLEKNHIPIDMIVGTSMGSFIGGLYASGKTPLEIEKMLVSTKWREFITTDFNRQRIPMRKKALDYTYQGKLGVGINAKNNIVLPTGVLKREPLLLKFISETQNVQDINDFDKLSIPFRAVATNIKNGDAVILKSGSLAKAIYASSAIPGGLQPINIDGIDLVDGGISHNLPIEVARSMGADIIIAVDVSQNFNEDLNIDSYLVIMGQISDILTRKNVNESIKTLTDKDILLTPKMDDFSGLDVDKYSQIIKKGEEIAYENLYSLKKLAISDNEYNEYVNKNRNKHIFNAPIIHEIRIQNNTYVSNKTIRNKLNIKIGERLDETRLRKDILNIYHMMIFDSVNYSLQTQDNKNILVITVKSSWDYKGEVRFALGLEDDFKGHSSYSVKLGYTMFGLNSYGAEWQSQFEIGDKNKVYTEIFQPLNSTEPFYIRPSLVYKDMVDIFPTSRYGNTEIESIRTGGSISFGKHISTDYQLELGISYFKDKIKAEVVNINEAYKARPLYASFKIDNLDNVNFPTVGIKSDIIWTKESHNLGSEYSYEQIYVNVEKPFNFYSNNVTFYLKYGNTYSKNDQNINRIFGTFSLGGLFNLSGYTPYTFNGDNIFLGMLRYTYKLKDSSFFGSLNAPFYAGFSLEGGSTWNYKENLHYDMLDNSATVYLAADTILGPFYLAYGYASDGTNSFYLYLGEKF